MVAGSLILCLAACGPSASGLASTACVSGVVGVSAGPNGSLYLQDARGIVHYSTQGSLLAHFGPKSGDWAVDRSGDVYYLEGKDIVKVSSTGVVLRRWYAPMMEPEAVNPQNGDVVAVYGGSVYAGSGPDRFELFSPSGRKIHRWSPSYSANLAFDAAGDVIATAQTNAQLVAVDPETGRTVLATADEEGSPFDAVGSDNRGDIYLGGENDTDTPFIVERVTIAGDRFHFKTINSSEESVGGLTAGTNGTIYVIRNSYDEPGPTDTGLEELSPSGSSLGKFATCKKG